ncbi:MAG: hypothetical protein IKW53_04075 [Clostridia bacterium]|nr:hypothetical protein [Clostridia bacterium]
MKFTAKNGEVLNARSIALVGIMAATLECGKLALSFLPNIEVVTILCALYGYVFGIYGIIATAVFVCIEPLIYGFGSWIITYFIYWPLVAFVFMLLRKKGVKSRLWLTVIAVVLTVGFGVISSIVDTAFYLGINKNYLSNLVLYYVRGIVFYIVQIACNAVLFPTLFLFLVDKLEKIKPNISI